MRVLPFLSLFMVLTSCDEALPLDVCAGYALPEGATLEKAMPEGGKPLDVNADGQMDALVALADGGSALYLDCGDETSLSIMRSATALVPQGVGDLPWQSFSIDYEGKRSVVIGDTRYRNDMLPLIYDDPVEVLIEFDGTRYAMDFPACEGLDMRAPIYSGLSFEGEFVGDLPDLAVELAGARRAIRIDEQTEFGIGAIIPLNMNDDGIDDLALIYADRYGSGRDRYGAVMLGCGDGGFIVSGRMQFGAAGGEFTEPEKVPGGLLIEQRIRPPFDDPLAEVLPHFVGYRIDPKTLGLSKIADSEDRRSVTEALAKPAQ